MTATLAKAGAPFTAVALPRATVEMPTDDAYGRADLPARTVLRSSADGSVLCVMEVADVTALERVGWRCPTPFEGVAADGVTVANADTIAAATHSHSS